MAPAPLAEWQRIARTQDVAALAAWLAADAVFHSPVVHTPQVGRRVAAAYLGAALHVFGNDSFRYVRQFVAEQSAALEFELEIDGIHINGVDLIAWNDAGQVTEFKVMLRPLKAIQLIHQKMAAALGA